MLIFFCFVACSQIIMIDWLQLQTERLFVKQNVASVVFILRCGYAVLVIYRRMVERCVDAFLFIATFMLGIGNIFVYFMMNSFRPTACPREELCLYVSSKSIDMIFG